MSALLLKLIGLILMILDHLKFYFPSYFSIHFRYLGRISAPIFFFLLVEGFRKTKNKKKYLCRLLFFSFIMMAGNGVIKLYAKVWKGVSISSFGIIKPNIFLNMAVCFIILILLENCLKSKNKFKIAFYIILILCCGVAAYYLEYSLFSIFMILTFYLFNNRTRLRNIIFVIGSIILCIALQNYFQIFMVLSLFLINAYDGRKGRKVFLLSNKYFYYLFYCIHQWVFVLYAIYLATA
ncbi:TraX family protein [Clostridium sp.]|uniref:TraX family protein n=1 Tax=Clostridium sp. TaxID=1506 RepID=UPI001B48C466|nr:TraX family protein [Clostridium sp.]MBP3914981.1 hypothetical protein [Clostridium sp.]